MMRKSLITSILLILCLIIGAPASEARNIDQQQEEAEAAFAAQEILAYVLLAMDMENLDSYEKQQAVLNIIGVYNNGESNSYFRSKKLSAKMKADVLKYSNERQYLRGDFYYGLMDRFEELVLSGNIYAAMRFYTNPTYALVRVSEVLVENGDVAQAKSYLNLAYSELLKRTDSTIFADCMPQIVKANLAIGEYQTAFLQIEKDLSENVEVYRDLVNLFVEESKFDEAFYIINLMESDRDLQLDALVEVAVGYTNSQVTLDMDKRKIIQDIVVAAIKE